MASSGSTRRRKESAGKEWVERLLVEYVYRAVATMRSFCLVELARDTIEGYEGQWSRVWTYVLSLDVPFFAVVVRVF